jgi:S1-C subfamily serine protease
MPCVAGSSRRSKVKTMVSRQSPRFTIPPASSWGIGVSKLLNSYHRPLRISRLILIFLLPLIPLFLLYPKPASCSSMGPDEIYKMARPAVVIVESELEVEFSVPGASVNLEELEKLAEQPHDNTQGQVSRGGVAGRLFREVIKDPLRFVQKSSEPALLRSKARGKTGGSGFIVSQDGHVATNLHCVTVTEKMRASLFTKFVPRKEIERALDRLGSTIPALNGVAKEGKERDAWYKALTRAVAEFYHKNGEFEEKVSVKVLEGFGGHMRSDSTREHPAKILVRGELGPGKKDVAILKIDGTNFSTVPLGDDALVHVGSQVYLVSFPGVGFDRRAMKEESRFEPTIMSGLISSKKAVSGGWDLFQTDMNIASGSSGGPIFGSDGTVVAMATFALAKLKDRERFDSIHFGIPVRIIKEFLNQLNAK